MAWKFTPGPWHADRAKDGGLRDYHQIDVTGRNGLCGANWPLTVADTSNRDRLVGDAEDAANARLIASAPDMYDLLNALDDLLDDYEDVIDGDYGEPRPNRAMSMRQEIVALLARIDGTEGGK